MGGRGRKRFRSIAIERLHIHHRFDQPLLVHIRNGTGNSAERKSGGNSFGGHALFKKTSGSRGRCAGPRLHGKAFFEIAGVLNHVRSPPRDEQFTRIFCDTSGTDANERRIAYVLHLHNQVHAVLRNARGIVREGYDLWGQQHDVARILCIHLCVAK